MKVEGEVPLEEIDRHLGGALSTPGPVVYCDVCDGLRPKEHACLCWVSRKPVSECWCLGCEQDRKEGAARSAVEGKP